ncbi:SDR family oxidoreductase [Streptomyces sp. NBC_01455]|uniref:SDR family oxidoreductase n=1 Tax=Streptomyces sp. NBC_01455 TaxID=2903874 RepID=UPI003FCCED64
MGAATAERLAELGATAVVLARRKDKLQDVVHRIEAAGGTALALPVDVTDRAAVQTVAHQVADRFGHADLVFNNAGVQLISGIEELKVDDWQRQIDLNITGLMNVIAGFLPHLTDSAQQGKPADLINTSSIAATRILEKFSVYSGTKAYISHLTRLLRVELGPKMVRVATIEPGMVDTELPDHVTDPDASRLMADLIHDIDCLQSTDIAETVAFMAALPRHVNLTQITIMPTAQAICGAAVHHGSPTGMRVPDRRTSPRTNEPRSPGPELSGQREVHFRHLLR